MDADTILKLCKEYNSSAPIVAVALEKLAGGANKEVEVSYADITELTGFSKSTISNALHILKALGLLEKHRIRRGGNKVIVQFLDDTDPSSSLIKEEEQVIVRKLDDKNNDEHSSETPFNVLSDAFSSATGVPFHTPPKWIASVTKWLESGAEPGDVAKAAKYMLDIGRTIIGPWSIDTPVMVEIGKRKSGGNGSKPREEVFIDPATLSHRPAGPRKPAREAQPEQPEDNWQLIEGVNF